MPTQIKTEVYCSLLVEGTHDWNACPYGEVDYLRTPHRHVFHIKAHMVVNHNDRDQEFIILKHDIASYFQDKYYNSYRRLCEFGSMSCEMIATELLLKFNLSQCDVSEDGENGATVTIIDK